MRCELGEEFDEVFSFAVVVTAMKSSIVVWSGEVEGSEQQELNGVARGFPPPPPLPLHAQDIRGDVDRTQLIEVIK